MTQEMPEATGNSGQPNFAASSDVPAPPRTDDELRRYAAERLADHLTIGVDLASRCEMLSMKADLDKVGPINAAARLMQSNARIAEALATVAQVERRRRTIVEHHQSPNPTRGYLNSSFERRSHVYTEEEAERLRASLLKKINALSELHEQEEQDCAKAHTPSETDNI